MVSKKKINLIENGQQKKNANSVKKNFPNKIKRADAHECKICNNKKYVIGVSHDEASM